MDIEKRILLAVALSMAVLILSPYLLHRLYPPPPIEEIVVDLPEELDEPPVLSPHPVEPLIEPPQDLPDVEVTQAEPRELVVENRDLIMTWSNEGAVLRSVRLVEYGLDDNGPLEILPQNLPAHFPRPLGIRTDEDRLNSILETAVFEVEEAPPPRLKAPVEFTFIFRHPEVEVVRVVRVPEEGYLIEVATEVRSRGVSLPYSVTVGAGIGEFDAGASGDFSNPRIACHVNAKLQRFTSSDLESGAQELSGAVRWVGIDSHYFSYLVIAPEGLRGATLSSLPGWPALENGKTEPYSLVHAEAWLRRGASIAFVAAPKDFEVLAGIDGSLTQLVDFGWFGFLVKPLLFSLKFIHGYVHNYGWAIIILTFIINLALFPIRYKQMVSMKKLAALQPKMKSIQDKYRRMKRDDPRKQQMNQEVMALYKEQGVNPLGGCLPLLLQMPFLFAFYQMLASSIELRGAPFVFWIQDLSRHDPYYITPIVMGVSMLAQQAIMPGVTDPMQRRMMMLLPIVFTFFFLGLSSGLVIYFLFSNVFAMMFQLLMQKWNPELAPGASPAKPSKKKS